MSSGASPSSAELPSPSRAKAPSQWQQQQQRQRWWWIEERKKGSSQGASATAGQCFEGGGEKNETLLKFAQIMNDLNLAITNFHVEKKFKLILIHNYT